MVRQDGPEHEQTMKAQQILVENGALEPNKVEKFFPNNKIIGLSSASYKFESLYRDHYIPYVKTIMDPEAKDVNHCVFRMSYRAAPKGFMEQSAIEDMKRSMSQSMFNRELEAIFTDDTGGYFSAQAIDNASAKLGEYPIVQVVGNPMKKYILAIDPNFNNAEHSDDFAMAVIEIDEENESGTLVHAYALANSTNEKRCYYLKYLLEKFNIVYIIVDNAGGPQFIDVAKEFKLINPDIGLFEHDFTNLNQEEGISFSKANYKPNLGKIVHSQVFGANNWIRLANENLQYMIEKKKIIFATAIFNESDLVQVTKETFPITSLHYSRNQDTNVGNNENSFSMEEMKQDFADHLHEMIELTKKECILIEVTNNSSGHQQFNLPVTMKRDKNPHRARRDSYTALLLASWGLKCYVDMHRQQVTTQEFIFSPRMFN